MSDTLCFNDRTWTAAELAALAGPLHIRDGLYLLGYAHPLPSALTSVGGGIYLSGYAHPLPATLTSVGGDLDLSGYAPHPLPAGLAHRDTRTVAR